MDSDASNEYLDWDIMSWSDPIHQGDGLECRLQTRVFPLPSYKKALSMERDY